MMCESECSHLGVLEGFVSSHECGFNRLGNRVNFACSSSLAQPRAGMVQPVTIVKDGRHTSESVHLLAEVKFTFLEAV